MQSILCASRRVVGSVLLAAALVPAAALAAQERPFKAELGGLETLVFGSTRCPAGSLALGQTFGGGQASHLGAVAVEASDCITPTETGFMFRDGLLTLVAANGDLLRATYQGSLEPTAEPGVYKVVDGIYTITGGTGRFANAAGRGTLGGTARISGPTAQARYAISGTIVY